MPRASGTPWSFPVPMGVDVLSEVEEAMFGKLDGLASYHHRISMADMPSSARKLLIHDITA